MEYKRLSIVELHISGYGKMKVSFDPLVIVDMSTFNPMTSSDWFYIPRHGIKHGIELDSSSRYKAYRIIHSTKPLPFIFGGTKPDSFTHMNNTVFELTDKVISLIHGSKGLEVVRSRYNNITMGEFLIAYNPKFSFQQNNELKVGDWYYNPNQNLVYKIQQLMHPKGTIGHYKILQSDNSDLGLPPIDDYILNRYLNKYNTNKKPETNSIVNVYIKSDSYEGAIGYESKPTYKTNSTYTHEWYINPKTNIIIYNGDGIIIINSVLNNEWHLIKNHTGFGELPRHKISIHQITPLDPQPEKEPKIKPFDNYKTVKTRAIFYDNFKMYNTAHTVIIDTKNISADSIKSDSTDWYYNSVTGNLLQGRPAMYDLDQILNLVMYTKYPLPYDHTVSIKPKFTDKNSAVPEMPPHLQISNEQIEKVDVYSKLKEIKLSIQNLENKINNEH